MVLIWRGGFNTNLIFCNVLRGRMENQHLKPLQRKATVAICLLATSGVMPAAHAELALNFQPVPSSKWILDGEGRPIAPDIQCMPGVLYRGGTCVRGNPEKNFTVDPDNTPMIMERITEGGGGLYHVMLGDPNSDFAQEYYITFSGPGAWPESFQRNASAGNYNGGTDAQPKQNWTAPFYDPLSTTNTSGSATGRPDRVIFRQVVRGTGFRQEVLKASFFNKPKITQTVSDNEMTSNFALDMSSLVYTGASALTTAGAMTNTMLVTDSQTGQILTNFDINTTSQKANINGGRFSYATGTGTGGSFGTYTYATGTYNIYSTNWAAFSDPTANIPNY